jgi:hypothetical protein
MWRKRKNEGRLRRFDQKTLITETTKEWGGENIGCDFLWQIDRDRILIQVNLIS